MTTSRNSPRRVLFPNSGNVTTLLQMARRQAERTGQRIRERRKELGLGQRQLAELIPSPTVTSDYISKWERGENKPSDEHMQLLATALETTDVDLLAGPLAERKSKGDTPDLSAALNGDTEIHEQLADLQRKVDLIVEALGLEPTADVHPLQQINDLAAALPSLLEGNAATEDATDSRQADPPTPA